MGLKGWFLGGRDELGWDDLQRRVIAAIADLARYGSRGSAAFPPEVEVEILVAGASVDVVRSFLDNPDFDRQVQAGLANRCDCAVNVLPLRSYSVDAGDRTEITARENPRQRTWQFAIQGGDRDGSTLPLPSAQSELRFGRGEWHGGDRQLRNDLVVCEQGEFVSRRAGRLLRAGGLFEIEALDQGDYLLVRRAGGEVVRPSRTGSGRVALHHGDTVELSDGKSQHIRLLLEGKTP